MTLLKSPKFLNFLQGDAELSFKLSVIMCKLTLLMREKTDKVNFVENVIM